MTQTDDIGRDLDAVSEPINPEGVLAEVWVYADGDAELLAIQGRSTPQMWDDLHEWLAIEGVPVETDGLYLVPVDLETGPNGDSKTYWLRWLSAALATEPTRGKT